LAQQGSETQPSQGHATLAVWNSTSQHVIFYMSGNDGNSWVECALNADEIESFTDRTVIKINTLDSQGSVKGTKQYQLKFNHRYAIAVNQTEQLFDVYESN
jgi:hypothetical protein